MKLVTVRRISQVFFLALFVWFCAVSILGRDWWQLRGWPVNWFLQLDPLLGLATALATGTLYAGLAWGLFTMGLTLILGRFFCGWVCPLGAINHFMGWLAFRRKPLKQKLAASSPGPGRKVKYYLLAFLLAAAGAGLPARIAVSQGPLWPWLLTAAGLVCVLGLTLWQVGRKALWPLLAGLIIWSGLCLWLGWDGAALTSLQTGLLDPIPLLQRSVNLVLLPLLDHGRLGAGHRLYAQGGLILGVLLAALGLNFLRPRFYCRYICPLGALFGVLGRFSFYSLGKEQEPCRDCRLCQSFCQGASDPAGALAKSECLLCLNCREACPEGVVSYASAPSASGETGTDLDRRWLMGSFLGGAVLGPALRLGRPGRGENLRPGAASRLSTGGAFPGGLHQMRPVRAHLPHRGHPARRVTGRAGGALDPGDGFQALRRGVFAGLRGLRPSLPHRGHPSPRPGGAQGPGGLRNGRAGEDRYRLREPEPLPALGHG